MRETAEKLQPQESSRDSLPDYSLVDEPIRPSDTKFIAKLRLLWSHRRFLLRAVAVGVVLSGLIAFLIPKSYVSTTELMPPDSQASSATSMAMMATMAAKITGGLGSMGGLGGVAGDLLGVKSSGALFVGVLRSRTVEDSLVQQFDLRKVYGKRLAGDARKKLDENTSISEDRKSGIITIMVTDHSPQRATSLANAYVDQLNSLVADLSTSSAHRERVFLEARLKVVKQNLDDVTKRFADFSSNNSTLDIQEESKAMLNSAADLEGQLVAAQAQLEGLRQIYTDNNPRVQTLKARVTEIQKELGKLSGRKTNLGGPPPPTSDGSSGLPYPSIRDLPLLGVQYMDYYRDAKVQETVFELLTQQYELAKVQEAKETPSVKVLDLAVLPEEKSFPPRAVFILVGTSIVLIVCILWILAEERWKDVDPADPRKILLQEIADNLRARIKALARRSARDIGNNGLHS